MFNKDLLARGENALSILSGSIGIGDGIALLGIASITTEKCNYIFVRNHGPVIRLGGGID